MIPQGAVLALVILVAYVHGESNLVTPGNIGEDDSKKQILEVDLNDIFDRALPTIQKMIIKGGLDPMTMPDEMLTITNIPGLRGKIHLQQGWVQEASTLRRTGDVIVRYSEKKLDFDLSLGWNLLDVTYSYTLKYMLYTRKGDFNGRFQNVKIGAVGSFDLNTRKMELRFFKINKIGKFSLQIHGHLVDPLVNALTKSITILCRDLIVREIEYRFEEGIKKKINDINEFIPEPWFMRTVNLPWDRQ